MAGKEIKNRITLDASKFERGAGIVARSAKRMQGAIGTGMRRAALAGAAGLLAAGATGITLGAGIARGVKGVINLGADLDHLRAQTGASVSELMLLQQAMVDNGVSAESARKALNKMQKSIVEAGEGLSTPTRALDRIGLSLTDLEGRDPGEQFRILAAAISKTEDPAIRAATAMDIFGRAGAEMQGVFASDFEDVARTVGKQAELLEKNSVLFERVGTLLDRAGKKLQGFFVGIADKVVPIILPLLEKFDALDLAEQGQKFGQGIATGLQAIIGLFQNNTIGELFKQALLIAGKEFINTLARGWSGLIAGVGKALLANFTGQLKLLKDGFIGLATGLAKSFLLAGKTLVNFLKEGFLGIAKTFAGSIIGAIGTAIAKIPTMEERGQAIQREGATLTGAGADHIGRAQQTITGLGPRLAEAWKPLAETIKNAPGYMADRVTNAFIDGMVMLDGIDIFDIESNKNKIASLLKDALAAGAVTPAPPNTATVSPFEAPENSASPLGPSARALTGGVSSLAAIGGGGGVGTIGGIENAIQAGNQLLSQINAGIRGLSNKIGGISNERGGISNTPVLL